MFFQKCRTFTKRLSVENIKDLMTTECVQYVIIQATDSYFGFDLLDEVEQACIFALIYTKATDFVNGWMVSKVMPQWVRSYSDWLAFEKQVGKVSSGDQNQLWKIPQSVSYSGDVYTDEDKSSLRLTTVRVTAVKSVSQKLHEPENA